MLLASSYDKDLSIESSGSRLRFPCRPIFGLMQDLVLDLILVQVIDEAFRNLSPAGSSKPMQRQTFVRHNEMDVAIGKRLVQHVSRRFRFAIFSRRLPDHLPKDSIEMGQRLKSHIVGDFTNP